MSGDNEKIESMNDQLSFDEEEKEPLLSNSESSSATLSRSPSPESESESESESEPTDARFNQPPASRLKRTFLLMFLALLFCLMCTSLLDTKRKPKKVIHASRSVVFWTWLFSALANANLLTKRYSKDYKFRPAASPIVTETLKDGRVRLRGALPTPTTTPPVVKPKRKSGVGKASGKRKRKSKTKAVNQRRM